MTEATFEPGRGRRVLLVDDDDLQRKLVKLQLKEAGFAVTGAAGAEAACAMLASQPAPAAIVSDVVMDGVDGFSFCRMVRSMPELSDVPLVLLSATFDEEADRHLATAVGAFALVQRTPRQTACIEALLKSLEERRHFEAPPSRMPAAYDGRLVHQLARLSDRKAATEVRYEMLFEHASDAISLTTPDGIMIDVNRKWTEILGLSRDAICGRHIREFALPGAADANDRAHEAAVRGERLDTMPIPIRTADGRRLLLAFTNSIVEIDGAPAMLSIGRDITSLVEAREKLAASERLYRSMVENVPDVVCSATHDWKITYLSPNVEKMCGYTAEDILAGAHGATLARVHPDDLEPLRVAREALAREGTPIDQVYRWQHRDGRWLWLHSRAVRSPNGIDGLFTDVTARRELEAQLFQAQKLEAMGQLVAGVAHDFNNTLAVIAMNASMLVESLDPKDPAHEIACDVVSASAHGTELTKQLLAFSRPTAQTRSTVYLDGLLESITRMLTRTLGTTIRLDIRRTPGLAPIEADASQLEQLVTNLAVNARDAMDRQGQLKIRTACIDLDAPRASDSGPIPAGRWVRLSITDTGMGMDEATRRQIFEPFFTTKKNGGTGLGLSICRGIVRQSNGYIEVESKLGAGTTFHVYFPRRTSVANLAAA